MCGQITEQEVKSNVKILGINHEETAWKRDIEFEYEGKRYSCELSWDSQYGFEMTDWGNMPVNLRSAANGFICQIFDEMTYLVMEGENA